MLLNVIGINYKTAPIHIREKWSFNKESTVPLLKQLIGQKLITSGILISTCNRTELYCCSIKISSMIHWLMSAVGIDEEEVHKYFYIYNGLLAVKHLMRVASGLDSMLLGETEILGQIKKAFQLSKDNQFVQKELDRLFQVTFSTAKKVRTETDIGKNPISIANIAVNITNKVFEDISKKNFLLVGAGEMIKLVKEHLVSDGVTNIKIANRTKEHAMLLAINTPAKVCSLDNVKDILHQIDVVISCTASQSPVIQYEDVALSLARRKYEPMMIIDMGVPRDIDSQVKHIEDVYLYCIDDLQEVMEENKSMRQEAALEAEKIITKESIKFFKWLQEQSVVPIIQDFKLESELIRDTIVDEALTKLECGNSPEMVVQWLGHVLTNKLTHNPVIKLKQITIEQNITDDIISLLKQLK